MPNIFDNINQRLLPALQQTLETATHADPIAILRNQASHFSQTLESFLYKSQILMATSKRGFRRWKHEFSD